MFGLILAPKKEKELLNEEVIEKLVEKGSVNLEKNNSVKEVEEDIKELEEKLNEKKRKKKKLKTKELFEKVYQKVYDKLCKYEEKDEELEEKLKGIENISISTLEEEFQYFFEGNPMFLSEVHREKIQGKYIENPIEEIFNWMVEDYDKRLHFLSACERYLELLDNRPHVYDIESFYSFNIKCHHIPKKILEENPDIKENMYNDLYWEYLDSKYEELLEILCEKFEVSKENFETRGANGGWLVFMPPNLLLLSRYTVDAWKDEVKHLATSPKVLIGSGENMEDRVLRELSMIEDMKEEIENFVNKVETKEEFAKFMEENISE